MAIKKINAMMRCSHRNLAFNVWKQMFLSNTQRWNTMDCRLINGNRLKKINHFLNNHPLSLWANCTAEPTMSHLFNHWKYYWWVKSSPKIVLNILQPKAMQNKWFSKSLKASLIALLWHRCLLQRGSIITKL